MEKKKKTLQCLITLLVLLTNHSMTKQLIVPMSDIVITTKMVTRFSSSYDHIVLVFQAHLFSKQLLSRLCLSIAMSNIL
jgi:choline kinase